MWAPLTCQALQQLPGYSFAGSIVLCMMADALTQPLPAVAPSPLHNADAVALVIGSDVRSCVFADAAVVGLSAGLDPIISRAALSNVETDVGNYPYGVDMVNTALICEVVSELRDALHVSFRLMLVT